MSDSLKMMEVEIKDFDTSLNNTRKIGMGVIAFLAVSTTGILGGNLAFVGNFVVYLYALIMAVSIGSMCSGGGHVERKAPDWFNATRVGLLLVFVACGLWLVAITALASLFIRGLILSNETVKLKEQADLAAAAMAEDNLHDSVDRERSNRAKGGKGTESD